MTIIKELVSIFLFFLSMFFFISFLMINKANQSSLSMLFLVGTIPFSHRLLSIFRSRELEFLPGVGMMIYGATVLYISAKIGIHGVHAIPCLVLCSLAYRLLKGSSKLVLMQKGILIGSLFIAIAIWLVYLTSEVSLPMILGSSMISIAYMCLLSLPLSTHTSYMN